MEAWRQALASQWLRGFRLKSVYGHSAQKHMVHNRRTESKRLDPGIEDAELLADVLLLGAVANIDLPQVSPLVDNVRNDNPEVIAPANSWC